MGILDLIYPKKCVGCGREGKYICEECESEIGVEGGGLAYRGVVRRAIKEIKYRGSYDMVAELVAIWMNKSKILNSQILKLFQSGWVVTSVPMWGPKKRERGFNQAELIARELAKRWELTYEELLVRVRETKPMYGLRREERRENIRGAFEIINQSTITPMNQRIILVDDVWTSGATTGECAKVLKAAGAKVIKILALAR